MASIILLLENVKAFYCCRKQYLLNYKVAIIHTFSEFYFAVLKYYSFLIDPFSNQR